MKNSVPIELELLKMRKLANTIALAVDGLETDIVRYPGFTNLDVLICANNLQKSVEDLSKLLKRVKSLAKKTK